MYEVTVILKPTLGCQNLRGLLIFESDSTVVLRQLGIRREFCIQKTISKKIFKTWLGLIRVA